MYFKLKYFFAFIPLLIIISILIFPDIATKGASYGLIISANVIVPSLFPFMVCVLMYIKGGFCIKNNLFNKVLFNLFGHNFDMFFVFILSMIGGYPVGAKLINELYKDKSIDSKTANIMLFYCVNAGPAFVIIVVGKALGSFYIGKILLLSHLFSSLLIAIFCGIKLRKLNCYHKPIAKTKKSFYITFTESVTDAAGSILNVCGYVIFFSVINSFIEYFSSNMTILKYVAYLTEITYALANEKNVLIISFLLGFSGISICCQVLSLTKNININTKKFIMGRIIHALLSSLLTLFFISIFKVKTTTFSNNVSINKNVFYSDAFLFLSMIIMLIVLLIFIYSKNNSGKLLKDMV